ncbi:helix-turn-helix domain-containing protein, partial [Lactiplantibacillus pentosus]|uniref:helix-turn-helix domain-containing protein n=1 Tax=Lactiplantibacillus pentosus TaxID=1589 RepID=UPI003C1615D2
MIVMVTSFYRTQARSLFLFSYLLHFNCKFVVRKKGQHLTSFERGRIATLHSQGYSNRAIARALNVCHQTINNELCRGEIDQVKKVNGQRQYYAVYSPETAQAKYEANRA